MMDRQECILYSVQYLSILHTKGYIKHFTPIIYYTKYNKYIYIYVSYCLFIYYNINKNILMILIQQRLQPCLDVPFVS